MRLIDVNKTNYFVEVIIMSKLYFRYSTMSAGKSMDLLKVAYNYTERGLKPFLLTSALDNRYGIGKITSRAGIQSDAIAVTKEDNIYEIFLQNIKDRDKYENVEEVGCVLIDEAQFLSKEQVKQLTDIVDYLGVPVICYGLRTDYRGELFEGSKYLLAYADSIEEIKTICWCKRKAIMNLKIVDGKPRYEGEQIEIGGNEKYTVVCRRDWKDGKIK